MLFKKTMLLVIFLNPISTSLNVDEERMTKKRNNIVAIDLLKSAKLLTHTLSLCDLMMYGFLVESRSRDAQEEFLGLISVLQVSVRCELFVRKQK